MTDDKPIIMRVLVGSRSQGLETPTSDYDWRYVYVEPTESLLSLYPPKPWKPGGDSGVEGWELGHFCRMALKCNPSILEALCCPPEKVTIEGLRLRSLFPSFLSKKYVADSFCGFAQSQKEQVLTRQVDQARRDKFLCHYLRMLWSGEQILKTGHLIVNVTGTPIEQACKDAKFGRMDLSEALALGAEMEKRLREAETTSALPDNPDQQRIEKFVLDTRLNHLNRESKSKVIRSAIRITC